VLGVEKVKTDDFVQVPVLLRDFKFGLHVIEKHHAFHSSYNEVSLQRRIFTHSHSDLQLLRIPPFEFRRPRTVLIMFPHLLERDLVIVFDDAVKQRDHEPALLSIHAVGNTPVRLH